MRNVVVTKASGPGSSGRVHFRNARLAVTIDEETWLELGSPMKLTVSVKVKA